MATTPKHIIVILCGGTGPRLWPLSKASKPKQFLQLFGKKSLLQQTIDRSCKIVPRQQIFVITNNRYRLEIKKHLGQSIPPQNFIFEPEKKNTTMAVIFASCYIQKLFPNCVITTTPSDHYVDHLKSFQSDLIKAFKTAQNETTLVTIGIKPTSNNPSYGYILPPSQFIEKPSPAVAQKLISQGAYWNSGIYTFSTPTLESELAHHQKEYFSLYQKLKENLKPDFVKKIYKLSPSLAFDYAISEKTTHLSMIPASFQWSDIGEWKTIYLQSKKDKNGIATVGSKPLFVNQNSQNCLLSGSGKKIIGLVGVENLAIIDTPEALLICQLSQSLEVRDLIGQIVANNKTKKYFLK